MSSTFTTIDNTTTAVPVTYTTYPTTSGTITTSPWYIDNNHYGYTQPPTYKFEIESPVTKKLGFIRMKIGFSKYDLIKVLGHLPDDVCVVNSYHCVLSNSIILMMTSDKFVECQEGTAISEIIIENEAWDYKSRSDFAKRVEERNE